MTFSNKFFQPEYILSLGDHFYFNGVVDEYDLRWKKTFEDVYDSEEMMVPWYPAMGNHDWNVLPDQIDAPSRGNGWAQIAYGQKEFGTKRWTHPDPFFTTEYTTENGIVVKTIMIDTPMFSGVYTGGRPKPSAAGCNVYDLSPLCVKNISPVATVQNSAVFLVLMILM